MQKTKRGIGNVAEQADPVSLEASGKGLLVAAARRGMNAGRELNSGNKGVEEVELVKVAEDYSRDALIFRGKGEFRTAAVLREKAVDIYKHVGDLSAEFYEREAASLDWKAEAKLLERNAVREAEQGNHGASYVRYLEAGDALLCMGDIECGTTFFLKAVEQHRMDSGGGNGVKSLFVIDALIKNIEKLDGITSAAPLLLKKAEICSDMATLFERKGAYYADDDIMKRIPNLFYDAYSYRKKAADAFEAAGEMTLMREQLIEAVADLARAGEESVERGRFFEAGTRYKNASLLAAKTGDVNFAERMGTKASALFEDYRRELS